MLISFNLFCFPTCYQEHVTVNLFISFRFPILPPTFILFTACDNGKEVHKYSKHNVQ